MQKKSYEEKKLNSESSFHTPIKLGGHPRDLSTKQIVRFEEKIKPAEVRLKESIVGWHVKPSDFPHGLLG